MNIGTLFLNNGKLYLSHGLKVIQGQNRLIGKPFPLLDKKTRPVAYSIEESIALPINLKNKTIEDMKINLDRLKEFLKFSINEDLENIFFDNISKEKTGYLKIIDKTNIMLINHSIVGVYEDGHYLMIIQGKLI